MKHSTRPTIAGIAVASLVGVACVAALPAARRPGTAGAVARPSYAAPVIPAREAPIHHTNFVHLVSTTRNGYRDGVYTGPTANAYYGWVQVQAVVRNGELVDIRILRYPSDRYTSRRIANFALPRLEREVIRAQSARIDAISGATLTSEAFMRSVQGALRRASA